MHATAKALPKLGIRNTRQRTAVVKALQELDQFVSTKTIHDHLMKQGNTVGLTTVYRTLQSLSEVGAVDVLTLAHGETLYRHCLTNSHHHHLVCTECASTVEIAGGPVEQWANSVASNHGYQITGHEAEVFGICPSCTAKAATQATA
ncbi:MAG: Fur family transcriptional regulator [Corynebacterium sp.]|nr:Fur family transcriptional regulator [Corynebacterium sp.]